jgi:hypothetical protein
MGFARRTIWVSRQQRLGDCEPWTKTNATERLKTGAIYLKKQPNQWRAEFFALPDSGFWLPLL